MYFSTWFLLADIYDEEAETDSRYTVQLVACDVIVTKYLLSISSSVRLPSIHHVSVNVAYNFDWYSWSDSIKSPASRIAPVSEPRLVSQRGRMREVVCA